MLWYSGWEAEVINSHKSFWLVGLLSTALCLGAVNLAAADIYSAALETRLTSNSQPVSHLSDTQRQQIETFYRHRNFRPLWINKNGLNARARLLLDVFKHANREALVPGAYRSLLLNSNWDIALEIRQTPDTLTRLEIDLTLSALLYARHASAGRIEPRKVNSDIKLKPVAEPSDKILQGISTTLHPEKYLLNLLPKHQQYLRLRKIYAHYLGPQKTPKVVPEQTVKGWPVIRFRGVIGYGMKHRAVVLLRQRLVARSNRKANVSSHLFDLELYKAVKAFQRRNNLWPDGLVGAKTLRVLNGFSTGSAAASPLSAGSLQQQKEQIALNMERYRWLPKNLGERHVFVNQPEYKLRAFDKGKIIHEARVIVGKRKHATPVFSHEVSMVVFNPNWNVPRSIAVNEILPRLKRDPYYLQRRNMTLYNGYTSRRVNSARVNWRRVTRKSFRYRIQQRPGRRNALGKIKFLFPNEHSIYLHDTPGKKLFKHAARAFSHGCVRVQNPQLLAEVLLSTDKAWTKRRIRRSINSGRRRIVKLSKKIPIHLAYFTTWVDNQGKIKFLDDVYGRDHKLNIVLNQIRVAIK